MAWRGSGVRIPLAPREMNETPCDARGLVVYSAIPDSVARACRDRYVPWCKCGVPVSRWVEFKALDPLQAHTYPPGLLARGDSARRVAHALLPIEPIERNRCPRLQNIPPYPPSWQAEFYRLWEKGLTTRACTEMRAAWSMRQCRVPEGVADMRKIASPPPPSLLLEGQRA